MQCLVTLKSPCAYDSSSTGDSHGILSTMHLDVGSEDWQSCSGWLRHLEVTSESDEEEEGTGTSVCAHVA